MALCKEGVISLISFILGFSGIIFFLFFEFTIALLFLSLIYISVVGALIWLIFPFYRRLVAKPAFFLGMLLAIGLVISSTNLSCRLCGWYIVTLSFFHWSEYFFTALTNPQNLSWDSYLLNHSLEYHLAVVASIIEYSLEWLFFPALTSPGVVSALGLAMVVFGEVVRKGAMWNAGKNFNHYIRNRREHGHELITTGIYGLCRHPAYVGWFCWSVGTQIMLCNPICTLLYGVFTWYFFRERILTEEYTLIKFFGEEYLDYQRAVPCGLPFISGYHPPQ